MDSSRYCAQCEFTADTAHAWNVHLKGMQHQRAMERALERGKELEEQLEKEDRDSKFGAKWEPQVTPLYRTYEEAIQATIGPIYGRPQVAPCSSLSESILETYNVTRPRAHIVARRKAIYKFVFRVCKLFFPECTLDVYGSIPHKLDSENSDIDMSISPVAGMEDAHVLARIAKGIECCKPSYLKVTRILHARIPVISIQDSLADDLHLDLSIWNVDKLHISTIFARYMEIDPRLRPLIFCVRLWSKVRGINDAFQGYVNSFAWTVAVVCYLLELKIVPVVDVDQDCTVEFVPADEGKTSVGDLLVGFFTWFRDWDIRNTRLSLRHGGVVPKEADKFEDYTYVCIERPRTPWQNITRQVEEKTWKQVRGELTRAITLLRKNLQFPALLDKSL